VQYGGLEMTSPAYQPAAGPPGSGQPFTYATDSPAQPPSAAASYYAKYSSSNQTTSSTTTNQRSGPQQSLDRSGGGGNFPHQPAARSPTPQSPPKRIDDLMSEFREFESVHGGGGSPTPPMFAPSSGRYPPTGNNNNNNSTVVVTELADEDREDERPARLTHPKAREDSADGGPVAGAPKGPAVYYPPGADFSKSSAPARPAADGGSMSLEQAVGAGKGKKQARAARGDRYGAGDGADKQGAAVIPICLPLCCAAPCVIM